MSLVIIVILKFVSETKATTPSFSDFVQMHREWCPTSTNVGCESHVNPSDTNYCCGYCNCEAACEDEGNCCLEEYLSFEEGLQNVQRSLYKCVDPNYYTDSNEFNDLRDPKFYIGRCNSSTPNLTVKELCEKPDVEKSLYSVIPVLDGKLHFRNVYCAICNDFANHHSIISYDIKVECAVTISLTYENMLHMIKYRQYNVTFEPPDFWDSAHSCHPYYIATCNVTGKWSVYNQSLELACNSFVDPFNMTYKNIFCYLCNTDTSITRDQMTCVNSSIYTGSVSSVNPPFLAVLDIDTISREISNTKIRCNAATQFTDEKMGVCRDILCDQSRYLAYNGKCAKKPGYDDPLCYLMFLKLSVTGHFSQQISLESLAMTFLSLVLNSGTGISDVDIYMTEASAQDNYIVSKFVLYEPDVALEMLSLLNHTSLYVGQGVYLLVEVTLYNLSLFNGQTTLQLPNKNSTVHDTVNRLDLDLAEFQLQPNTCTEKEKVEGDRLLGCPFIKLEKPNNLRINFVNGELMFEDTNLSSFSAFEYRKVNDGILICLSNYLAIYDYLPNIVADYSEQAMFLNEVSAKDLLALICVCISILCLIATIVVFILRSEFHSLPGVNTLMLCIFILLAQVFYQFGIGQTRLPNWACAAIGIICHMLWLCVMFSLNVCSVDMFRIFSNLTRINNTLTKIRLLKRLTYICLLSILFVVVNVAVSSFVSNGKNIGYGGIVCYISSKLMQIITFIIPSGFLILINITLFIYVVLKLRKANIKAANLRRERHYLGVYARLSTLTGFTWLCGFLLIIFKNEILEFVFIVLNASQGFLIMAAFIFNRRVFNVCCESYARTNSVRVTRDSQLTSDISTLKSRQSQKY